MLFKQKMFCVETMKDERDGCDDEEDDESLFDDILDIEDNIYNSS